MVVVLAVCGLTDVYYQARMMPTDELFFNSNKNNHLQFFSCEGAGFEMVLGQKV